MGGQLAERSGGGVRAEVETIDREAFEHAARRRGLDAPFGREDLPEVHGRPPVGAGVAALGRPGGGVAAAAAGGSGSFSMAGMRMSRT